MNKNQLISMWRGRDPHLQRQKQQSKQRSVAYPSEQTGRRANYPHFGKVRKVTRRVIFSVRKAKHIMHVSKNDLSIAVQQNFEDNLEFIWILNQYPGETKCHAARSVLAAAQKFYKQIDGELDFLEYDYRAQCTVPGYDNLPPTTGRGIGGVSVDGHLHMLEAGPGYCFLSLLETKPDGTGKPVKKIDCRALKTIQSDNLGDIKIVRKKRKLNWPKSLPPLIDFLKQLPDTQVSVQVIQGKPKFTDLIYAYQQGGGLDDWAGEELASMGEEAKSKLLDKLLDPKAKKYHNTIASILITVFPSKESTEAVEHLIRRQTDKDQIALLRILLDASGFGG